VAIDVRVRRLAADVALPRYQTAGAAGFDLAASEAVTIEPGQIALVPTGLVIEVPDGHFLGIFARSSTPLRRGLMVANGVGVVDSDYCGATDEIKIQVLNFTSSPVSVAAGDRLAQGVFLPYVRADWREVDEIDRQARGGFGSTGQRE
jgi:dUTP pyrophosphatase